MKSTLPFYFVPDPQQMPLPKGNLRKGILIISRESDATYNFEEDLIKILSALDIDIKEDTGIIALGSQTNISISHYFNTCELKSVLIFGAKQKEIGLLCQSVLYEWIQVQKLHIMFADSLSHIMSSKEYKIRLWRSLKTHF